jgi:hypothetical protein
MFYFFPESVAITQLLLCRVVVFFFYLFIFIFLCVCVMNELGSII